MTLASVAVKPAPTRNSEEASTPTSSAIMAKVGEKALGMHAAQGRTFCSYRGERGIAWQLLFLCRA